MSDDLERLRDILFGSQARTIEQQLDELRAQLAAARQDLTAELERSRQAADEKHLTVTRDIEQRAAHQASELESATAEILRQLQATSQELNERLRLLEVETCQRHERLQLEMTGLVEALQARAVLREDLGERLIEVGQLLKSNRAIS